MRVADRRDDGHLLLAVQLRDPAQRPGARRAARPRRAACRPRARACGAELVVQRIALRREDRQPVGAALEEDGDEHLTRRPVAAAAIPSSNARSPSREPPYTASAAPRPPTTNARRDSPVPAGSGIPGSIDGSPRPASAIARCSSRERDRPSQWRQSLMRPGTPGTRDQVAQRVQHHRRVLLLLPLLARRVAERAVRELLQRARRRRLPSGGLRQKRSAAWMSFPASSGCRPLAGIERVRIERLLRDPPAAAPRRRVEPARVVPAGDVRRIEELLSRHRVEPHPVARVDPAAEPAEESRGVDDRRLHRAAGPS